MTREWIMDATLTPHALGLKIQSILMVNPNIEFTIKRLGEFIFVEAKK
tara:strand:+ start:4101 stop:4244 length:144 start_codon:yes stop_codon:yes gene_type:complete